ncbi:sigma-70 family RNA polymerase sigma factor [Yinghuangia soli]|uniref:Sigma-70 family RNA polymerase sigma factor n=1 Tax=Yinghuangia soli TaxID=2908204 RepID=A0AA41PZS1_9ACTN|nr:sigma-70 family RNA polymerase sigma factor [Yinghuangia soli]MCF2527442.1 sigma-70 family RNA polymerase sigma factor [Yinghuangia soli]
MSREDDPSASGPDRQPPEQPADPAPEPAEGPDAAWVPGQGRHAGPPHPVVPGQRTARHRRGPFPAPRGHEPAGAGATGTGPADPAAPGAVPAPLGPPDDTAAAGTGPAPRPEPGPPGPGPGLPGDAPEPAPGADDGGAGAEHQHAADRGDDGPSDAYLADRVRDGDDAAYEVLYQRHVDAVRRLARLCTRTRENAEDLVGETFTRTLHALRSGHGPREACRPYLLTTVRRVAGDWARNERRVLLTDDVAAYEASPGGEPEDPAVAATDRNLAAKAFQELPERWQAVLWYTEVEREPRDRVAPLLGVSPNALSKLKERARDGLREAYLKVYVENGLPKECRPFAKNYGAYVRHRLGDRAEDSVKAHLDACDRCRAACVELASVSTCMRVVAEGLLGAAGLAYLATAAAAAAAVGAAVAGGTGAVGASAAGTGSAGAGAGAGAGSAGAAGAGSAGSGGSAGAGAAAEGGGTMVKAAAIAGAPIAVVAAVAWAFVANQDDPKKPVAAAPPPAVSPATPPPKPTPPPAPPVQPPATPPATPPPPKPTPPKSPPPKPAPPPVQPTTKPAPPPAAALPSKSPKPPKPDPPKPTKPPKPGKPTIIVEPTRIVIDNGRARFECAGQPVPNAGMPRCEHVTLTVPNRPANPNRPTPAPTCRDFGQPGNPRLTICRK